MNIESRKQRMAAELECLRALKKGSSILDFESTGDPPDHYTVVFRGRGICRVLPSRSEVEWLDLHRVQIRLPHAYPERPPDIRWITPIFHPNVSFSGYINLTDVGLPWERDLGLDVICERLWDVARMAFVDLAKATNYAAKSWCENQKGRLALPADPRPLRDSAVMSSANVFRYQRRGERAVQLPSPPKNEEVFYIGEDTPTPQLPASPSPPVRRDRRDGDDVLYIGDD